MHGVCAAVLYLNLHLNESFALYCALDLAEVGHAQIGVGLANIAQQGSHFMLPNHIGMISECHSGMDGSQDLI